VCYIHKSVHDIKKLINFGSSVFCNGCGISYIISTGEAQISQCGIPVNTYLLDRNNTSEECFQKEALQTRLPHEEIDLCNLYCVSLCIHAHTPELPFC
jgi:hypothetical protein